MAPFPKECFFVEALGVRRRVVGMKKAGGCCSLNCGVPCTQATEDSEQLELQYKLQYVGIPCITKHLLETFHSKLSFFAYAYFRRE